MRERIFSKLLYVLLLALATMLNAQSLSFGENSSLRYSGKLGVNQWYFPRSAPSKAFPGSVTSLRGQLDLTLQFAAPVEVRINQRFQYDPEDKNRNRYEIEDLYIDYFATLFELRAGLQIFSWKTVESVSIADFLNQTDLESDFLDAEKFAELAVRMRIILPTDAEQVLELYYLPRLRGTRFPTADNRFSFGLDVNNDRKSYTYLSSRKEWRPQIAVSFERPLLQDIDLRLFYFNGYNRFPGLVQLSSDNVADFRNLEPVLVHQYRPVHKAGLTFQGELGSWLLKGESVRTKYQETIVNQLGNPIRPEYTAWVAGFEYTLYGPVAGNHDLGIIGEIIGDTDSGKPAAELESFRPFQNHLFGGLRYTFNNISDRSLLLGAFFSYKANDILVRAEYDERILEVFTLKLAYNGIFVETSPLVQFEHTERFIAELTFNF